LNVLAIIPARSGSKGILNKNIRKLGKKPLIAHTIESAKESSKINKIVVSTDSPKIAKLANKFGAETPFLRPKKLSFDKSAPIDYVIHALNFLKINQNYFPEIVLILQPTTPIREKGIIDKSINKLQKTNTTSVISVTKIKQHPFLTFNLTNKNFLKPLNANFENHFQRQQYPDYFYPTGGIYTFWSSNIKKYNSIYGPRISPLLITPEDSEQIDTPFDFFISEMRLLHWKNFKKHFKK